MLWIVSFSPSFIKYVRVFWIDGGPPAGGVEGVAGDEHNDEKEEKEEEACSPGDDGPSPGVEAGRPAETPALPNVEVED